MKTFFALFLTSAIVFSATESFACLEVSGRWKCDSITMDISFENKDGVRSVNISSVDAEGHFTESEDYLLDGKKHSATGDLSYSYTAACLPTTIWFMTEKDGVQWIQTLSLEREVFLDLNLITDKKSVKVTCERFKN
jgi:hypothetical protein